MYDYFQTKIYIGDYIVSRMSAPSDESLSEPSAKKARLAGEESAGIFYALLSQNETKRFDTV